GAPMPPAESGAEDSHDALPAFLGDPAEPVREIVIEHSVAGIFAIRRGRWKWVEGIHAPRVKPAMAKLYADQCVPRLYDLAEDPGETQDVSADHPEIVAELRTTLEAARRGPSTR
ncbi:MAG: hypothetical protein ACR2IT_05160, partial [Pirellulales bacterium]